MLEFPCIGKTQCYNPAWLDLLQQSGTVHTFGLEVYVFDIPYKLESGPPSAAMTMWISK